MIVVKFPGIHIGLNNFHRFRQVFHRLRNFHQRDTLFRQAAGELDCAPRIKTELTQVLTLTPCQNVGFDNVMVNNLTVSQLKITGSPPLTVQFGNMLRCGVYPAFRQPEFALDMSLSVIVFVYLNRCGYIDFIRQVNTDPDRIVLQFIIRRILRAAVPFS
ncbi:hypothetical protein MOMOMA043M_19445 [Morganella morganii]